MIWKIKRVVFILLFSFSLSGYSDESIFEKIRIKLEVHGSGPAIEFVFEGEIYDEGRELFKSTDDVDSAKTEKQKALINIENLIENIIKFNRSGEVSSIISLWDKRYHSELESTFHNDEGFLRANTAFFENIKKTRMVCCYFIR